MCFTWRKVEVMTNALAMVATFVAMTNYWIPNYISNQVLEVYCETNSYHPMEYKHTICYTTYPATYEDYWNDVFSSEQRPNKNKRIEDVFKIHKLKFMWDGVQFDKELKREHLTQTIYSCKAVTNVEWQVQERKDIKEELNSFTNVIWTTTNAWQAITSSCQNVTVWYVDDCVNKKQEGK